MSTEPLRAIVYARVSTDEQARGQSPESQIASCRAEALRLGWRVVAEIVGDGAERGPVVLARPSLLRIAELAPHADVLVATAIDRLHRNKHEWELYKRSVLIPAGVRVHTLSGIPEDADPASWFASQMLDVNAEFYSRLTSWKTVLGMRRRAEAGLWLTTPPYGARKPDIKAGEERGVPLPDPVEWPWLLALFERAALGDSDSEIARWLTEHGAPPRKGPRWGQSTVADILRRTFYLGEVYFQGEVYAAQHQCRVPREVWLAAQVQREARRGRGRGGGRPSDYVYILPRVVADEFEVTHPPEQAGQPLPLYGKWCNGRGGVRYYYYYRADKLRANGGLLARRVNGAGELASMVRADDLERCVVEELARLAAQRLPWAFVRPAGWGDDERERLRAEQKDCAAEGGRIVRERRRLDTLLIRGFEEGARAADVTAALSRQLEDLSEREARQADRSARLAYESALASGAEYAQQQCQGQANLIAELWRTGDRLALRQVIGALVEAVVLRSDGAWLQLRPPLVCETSTNSAPRSELRIPLQHPGLRAA